MSCFSVKFLTVKKQFTITPRSPSLNADFKESFDLFEEQDLSFGRLHQEAY